MAKARAKASGRTRVKVGVIGCGNICGIYFANMVNVFEVLDVVAAADMLPDRAAAKAGEFEGVGAMSVKELLASDVDIVVNLTIPNAHAEVALAAVKAGKSVYNEKPLTIRREDGKRLLDLAKAKKVRVGGAPDTFLGAGIQTCVKLINDGWIGEPIGATAFMTCHGHESWHPAPEFYYKVGGGPMFDMGPYYLTALVALIGPVRRVTGMTRITFPERVITSQPLYGKRVEVEVPTHVAGLIEFENGAIGNIITTFDVWKANLPRIEVYGTEGSLMAPDPNTFGGPVKVMRPGSDWQEVPLMSVYGENSRGLGVADMGAAILSGRKHRASGELAYHVLDVMHAFHDASDKGRHVELKSTCERPAAMPLGLRKGEVEA
jgi:predicted dehydrogenase